MYIIRRLWNPEIYQGVYRFKNYFEGWYVKLIDKDKKNVLAVIPGISKAGSDSHAFIQVMDGITGNAKYYRFNSTSFHYSKKDFVVSINNNLFSRDELILNLPSMKGKLRFNNITAFPKTLTRPGIMGPFSFLPFMECYHGIVNIHHSIDGSLTSEGSDIDFSGGYGYIEKDWGKSFPKAWVWLQSNHFEADNAHFMLSIAKIPCFGTTFTGFLCFLMQNGNFHLFATYTGAKIDLLMFDEQKKRISAIISDNSFKLTVSADHSKCGTIKAPVKGLMKREITESISASINVKLMDKFNNIIFKGSAVNTGMEMCGDVSELINAEIEKLKKRQENKNVILD